MRTIRISGIFRLASDAAASYARMREDQLPAGGINSAWRSVDGQRRIFLSRYVPSRNRRTDRGPFGDVRKYEGVWYKRVRGLPVAVPGTSKHNQGTALDISVGRPVHRWLLVHGKTHGWSRPLTIADPVHWEYSPRRDKAKRAKPGAHVVTAGPLRGRAAPSTSARIVTKKRKGAVVVVERWVRAEGRVWGQARDSLYYAKEFLRRQG